MELYRDIDIQAITDKLDQIIDESIDIKNTILEPTNDEFNNVMEIIKDFIMKKKRVIYGGTAYNEIIKKQTNNSDSIYKKNDRKDIEFYTPDVLKDAMELANLLHSKKFKFVQVRQAMHAETYSLFVNFEQYCDMSYMPKNIYENMPTLNINGLLYTHPSWILVDVLRQYNDPITSYWRLKDKTFFRASLLLKYYPLDLYISKSDKNQSDKHSDIKLQIYKKIIPLHTLVFIGSVAENYYLTRSTKPNVSSLEVISTNYDNDIKVINKLISDILGEKYKDIEVNTYKPFFQFRDQHVEWIYDKLILLRVFGSNHKCIPFNTLHISNNLESIESIQLGGYFRKTNSKSSLKGGAKEQISIKLATFMVLFQSLLVDRHYWYINRSEKYKEIENKMAKLLKERNDYLKSKSITVMDSSPFKEFIIKCSGETIDQGREFRLGLMARKAKGVRLMFTYDPDNKGNDKVPDYNFLNTSGNLDKSDIKKIF